MTHQLTEPFTLGHFSFFELEIQSWDGSVEVLPRGTASHLIFGIPSTTGRTSWNPLPAQGYTPEDSEGVSARDAALQPRSRLPWRHKYKRQTSEGGPSCSQTFYLCIFLSSPVSFLGCWDTSSSHLFHEKCSLFSTWCLTKKFEANFLGIATFLLWMVEDFPLYSSIFNWAILRCQLRIMTCTDLGAQFDEFWQMYPPHATKP